MPKLEETVAELAAMAAGWSLEPGDWYVTGIHAFLLRGYDGFPDLARSWTGEIDLYVRVDRMAPGVLEAQEVPPQGALFDDCLARFPRTADHVRLFSAERYGLPVTFLKSTSVGDGHKVWLVQAKGQARILSVRTLRLIEEMQPPAAPDATVLATWIEHLRVWSSLELSRRDRWFGEFCRELGEFYAALAAGKAPRRSLVVKLGERFSVV